MEALLFFEDLSAPIKEKFLFRDTIVESVFNPGNRDLEDTYIRLLSEIKIPSAGLRGYRQDTWEPLFNRAHLDRLTNTIKVIIKGGHCHEAFLTEVIANLYMIDLFVPDEAVFQRYVSDYLNSVPLKERFVLHYLLLKRLPVYYNDVGATGRLRDLSTELDSWSNDPALYFLRKQIHVNGGHHNIALVEAVLRTWAKADINHLKGILPEELIDQIDMTSLKRYSEAQGQFLHALDISTFHDILTIKEKRINETAGRLKASTEIREKLRLIYLLYHELHKKYGLYSEMKDKNPEHLIEKMQSLKETFMAPEKTISQESLYYKRHIAFGIPSVMGTYREQKFDALKEFFKREELLRVCLEDIVGKAHKESHADIESLMEGLRVFLKALQCFGFRMPAIKEALSVLGGNALYLSQIIDIVRELEKELIFSVETFYRWFLGPVRRLLSKTKPENLSSSLSRSLRSAPAEDTLPDILIRQIITSVTGIQEYDRFLNSTLRRLLAIRERNDDTIVTKAAPLGRQLFVLKDLSAEEAVRLGPQIGTKGKNLTLLMTKGIIVPEGVVLPADYTFREPDALEEIIKQAVRFLEERIGRIFGSRKRPLFLSVRSGSFLSMPGILD
jgi:pyruvate,orthophosphate dikinase